MGTQLGCKLQLQAFAALYSWVGTQLGCKTAAASFCSALQLGGHAECCKTLFYSWWERSSAVKLQLQAFAALYSWVGTQLGRKTAAASVCSALRLVGELCGKTAAFYSLAGMQLSRKTLFYGWWACSFAVKRCFTAGGNAARP